VRPTRRVENDGPDAKQAKAAAARDVLARYGGELPDDSVTDLWLPAAT